MKFTYGRLLKVGKFFSRDGVMMVGHVLTGFALGASITAGAPAVIGVVAAIVGVAALMHKSIEKRKQHELLDIYREEISQITGKPKSSLTLKDLETVSQGKDPKGQGSKALGLALDYFKDTRNFYITTQAVTAGLVGTGLSLAYLGMPDTFSALGLAGASGVIYNHAFDSVRQVMGLLTEGNIRGTITHDIKQITRQISDGGRISSTKVMDLVVQANADVAKSIREEFGQPYADLSIADKRRIVAEYNDTYHVVDIARKVNTGQMLPTEMAFAVFGEASGVSLRPIVPEVQNVEAQAVVSHEASSKIIPYSTFAARLEAEKLAAESRLHTI